MRLPQIRMESVMARIGLVREKPVQSIEQPKAIVTIRQPKAILEIETEKGKLVIDQTQAWEDRNLQNILRTNEMYAEKAYQEWLKNIARRRDQGDELMRIENGGNPIARQAVENSEGEEKRFNVGWVPSFFSVKFHYKPAKVHIRAVPQKPVIEALPRKPVHTYIPGEVRVYMERWPSLKIDFVHLFDERV